MFVKPDGIGGFALVKEQQVGFDRGVRGKHTFRQADDGVQVALAQQQLLELGLEAVAEHKAIRQYHGGAAIFFQQFFDDQRHEHVGGFPGFKIAGKIGTDAILLIAAERRIGNQAIDFFVGTPIVPSPTQGVATFNLAGYFNTMQQHIGGTQQMRQLLFLNAANQFLDCAFIVGTRLITQLAKKVVDGGG